MKLVCTRCGVEDVPRVAWAPHALGRHLKASCSSCGAYLKFVPQTPAWVALAEEPPPTHPLFGGAP